MANMDASEQQIYQQQFAELIERQQTLLLSTVSEQAKPEASYAPFVRDSTGAFYVFVSELATHTKNMLQTGVASIMLIQAEQEAKNIFARERAVFDCEVNEVAGAATCYQQTLQAMTERFGETVALLASLPDFHLFALTPKQGKYIAGFGKAFAVDTELCSLRFE